MITKWRHSRSVLSGNPDSKELDARLRTSGMTARRCANIYCVRYIKGEDLSRHDKWLCMMYPRLKLLRELLADDGVIFVSIDENKEHYLRATMDEISGADWMKDINLLW